MSQPNNVDSSHVLISPTQLGICPGTKKSPPGAAEAASRLLQKNHDEHHMFWRPAGGHNHTVHNVLTRLALGADSAEVEMGFEDNLPDMRPPPPADEQVILELDSEEGFYSRLGQLDHYTNYLTFFKRVIDKYGWRDAINKFCFGRSRNADILLSRLFEGAFHPIIHVGLGVEFEQPSIIAEGLAQAATDTSFGTYDFFQNAERFAAAASKDDNGASLKQQPLVELFHEARANETIRNSAQWKDAQFKMRDGVLKRAAQEIASLAARFTVDITDDDALERRTAEMINCCAYFAGAAQRRGKARKIDFFYMHDVTSSIFLTVLARQPWIRVEDRARLVEHKARLDLVWYATCGAAELHLEDIEGYKSSSAKGWGWDELFRVINGTHDDGHLSKFVRALKNGEEVCKRYETGEWAKSFPVKGDMWLKLSHMAYDSTVDLPLEKKWLMFAGFDIPWTNVPNLQE